MMEIIRSTKIVKDGQILLDLPSDLSGQEVEVIVVMKQRTVSQRKSLRGALRRYAKPNLIALESDAWAKAMEEKYGDR
jgi:hypothetical protein